MLRLRLRLLRGGLLLLSAGLLAGACQAGVWRYCDAPPPLDAAQQDRLLRFAAIVKSTLERSGDRVALVARSGLDLSRFGMRYSHAGISLKASRNTPWSVRQLYYACDDRRPRIFDQGLSGFVFGSDRADIGYLSAVFLPADRAASLEHAALDERQATHVLGGDYSANAYPFSRQYQNCNQWLLELLATTWGAASPDDTEPPRARAQRWLAQQGYRPSLFQVSPAPLMWLGVLIPWVHSDDHPPEDVALGVYRVSMPASIEAFVKATVPGATRVEFCHTEHHVVVRRGWTSIPEGCRPEAGDEVYRFD